MDESRYSDFSYLCYLDIENPYVKNYVDFQNGKADPVIKGRIAAHIDFWTELGTPEWLLEFLKSGVKIPFSRKAPRIVLPNNKSAMVPEAKDWVRGTLREYEKYGFIKKVDEIPFCVMPLQIKDTGGKMALIYDMSVLNEYVQQASFKLEGWEEMFEYAKSATCGVKFDLKKFYHEIDIAEEHQKFFGFMYKMEENEDHTYFVWTTLPYGYTRAPYIARQIMKPLIAKWRRLGAFVVVFYDDGMAVSEDKHFLKKFSTQMLCDLLQAGLVPGVNKCIWDPKTIIEWNGLKFNFDEKYLSILDHRVEKTLDSVYKLLQKWPDVSYRDIARCVGSLVSMKPVFLGTVQIKTRMLQTIVNIRNYESKRWDEKIKISYAPLTVEAKLELTFWLGYLVPNNKRTFLPDPPTWTAWSDASDMAVGGFVAQLLPSENNGNILTADNWLLDAQAVFRGIRHCAQLQVDAMPWTGRDVIVRDGMDLNPLGVKKVLICHRNLDYAERAVDSNERELIGAAHLIASCIPFLRNSVLTLHMDNQNAVTICQKGSPKPRLQMYARLIFDLCTNNNILLQPVWIPRDLNRVADFISKEIDYENYQVTETFFQEVCHDMGMSPEVDLFADNKNAKAPKFFSLTYCPGTLGVNAFYYDWSLRGLNWIFVAPRLILRAIGHLELCKAAAFVLIPQWKTSYFYPYLLNLKKTNAYKKHLIYSGKDIFLLGADVNSYFGPSFNGNVEVWYIDFKAS